MSEWGSGMWSREWLSTTAETTSTFPTPHSTLEPRGPSSPTTGRVSSPLAGTRTIRALGFGSRVEQSVSRRRGRPLARSPARPVPRPTVHPVARGTDEASTPACPQCLSSTAGPVVLRGPAGAGCRRSRWHARTLHEEPRSPSRRSSGRGVAFCVGGRERNRTPRVGKCPGNRAVAL